MPITDTQRQQQGAKAMKLFLALTCSMLLLYSCKLTTPPKSSGKFAPLDPNADNYALIFGAPNDLKGVSKDVAEMENLLNNSGYGWFWRLFVKGAPLVERSRQ